MIEKLKIEDIPQLLELYKELTPYNNLVQQSSEIYKEMCILHSYIICYS